MPFVAFDVLAATTPHATRKPAAQTDREDSTQFADMLDKPDSTDQTAPKETGKDQTQPAQANSRSAPETTEPVMTAPPELAAAEPADTGATSNAPVTEQEIADFLAAVAAATGMKITPVGQAKADEKPAEVKPDDQGDDGAANPPDTAATPAGTKSADAAAIVVTAPADTTAPAPDVSVAKSAGIAAATAEQTDAKAVAADSIVVPGEVKDTKPQTAVKVETPVVTPNLAPGKPVAETEQADTALQPAQPAAQSQTQKPAAEASAPVAKSAPAQHDARAPDAPATKPADNVQPMLLVQNNTAAAPRADQATLTPAPAAATAPQAVALPVQGIAVEIAGKAMAGKNRFEIRLDPPELGRIHVRLDVDHKGEVTSIITADRSDTFDLLRRDAQALERALQDAGVKTANNGLQFSLRDHGGGRHDQPALADSARMIVRDDNLDTEIIAPIYRPFTGNRAGVDIRV